MLSERLALLVSMDSRGAVKGLESVGKAADRNLGRAQSKLDQTGQRLQKAGVGMMAFGALALTGLASAAKASEEANLAVVKLQNSLEHNPQLTGESAKGFLELADAIQSKTAADGDAVVAGMATLSMFEVTGDQLREITPLVVDYARRFGVDMVTANQLVGKALEGQVRGLKASGISIDETAYKADRYKAVQEALAREVGGFANREGKTFTGSLERIKNQLGDIVEGVGAGAADTFSGMLAPVSNLTTNLSKANPELLSTIGSLATIGSFAIAGAGGLAFVAGKAIQLGDSIKGLPSDLAKIGRGLWGVGKFAAGSALSVGLMYGAFKVFGDQAKKANVSKLSRDLLELSRSGKIGADALRLVGEDFDGLGAAIEQVAAPSNATRIENFASSLNRAFGDTDDDLSNARQKINDLDDALARLAEQDPEMAAAALVAIKEGLSPSDAARLVGLLGDYSGAMADAGVAAEATAGTQKDLNTELDKTAGLIEDVRDAVQSWDGGTAFMGAQLGVKEAIDDVNEAIKEHGRNSPEHMRAVLDARDALRDQALAAVDLYDQTVTLNGGVLTAREKNDIYRSSLEGIRDTLKPNNPLRQYLQQLIDKTNEIPAHIKTRIDFEANTAAAIASIDGLIGRLGILQGTYVAQDPGLRALYGIAPSVSTSRVPEGRAHGGGVSAGSTYMVGERGPELFSSSTTGSIIPNNQLGGATFNFYISALDPAGAARAVKDAVRAGSVRGVA